MDITYENLNPDITIEGGVVSAIEFKLVGTDTQTNTNVRIQRVVEIGILDRKALSVYTQATLNALNTSTLQTEMKETITNELEAIRTDYNYRISNFDVTTLSA